jgi:long-subunit fatty acid transport protein
MNRLLIVSTAVIGVLACSTSVGARADSIKPGQEKFKLMLGGFLPAFNTDVEVDNEDQLGDDVALGSDLGVDEDESGGWVGFEWRIAEKHRLGAMYSSFTMTGTRVIDRQITIGDEIYPVDATVTTSHQIELIPITYSYSFINNDSNEFAVTAGVNWNKITLSLTGSSSLSADDISTTASASADLPLPLFGIRFDHHFSDKWSAGGSAAFFSIEFAESTFEASGSLVSARAYAEYRFGDRFGAGVAIDGFKLDINAAKSRWTGEYVLDYWGPQLYITARF